MNIHVGCIARRQTVMGGFALKASPSPPPVASEAEDDDVDLLLPRMMMIEMLVLLVQMRCLLDTLTLCHS